MKLRLLLLSFLLLAACALIAQTFRGGVQGTVTDSTGAAVAGAEISVVSTETGLTRTTTTDGAGNYAITELPLGSYTATATRAGFRTQTARNVGVDVSVTRRIDFQLTPGQVQETVQVTAEIPLIPTTSNIMGGVIEGAQAAELPINGRDFTKFMTMVPGSTADPSSVSDSPGSFGLFSVNGNRGRSNNYLIDGTDMNDGYRNLPAINEAGVFGTPATILPIDALAEVPVLSGVEAEYGRNSGAIVNLVTKSGTNVLHGSAYEYFRNNALDARNYFNPRSEPETVFRNNQFGGSLGGPLFKDRTFWFLSYEGQRENGGIPSPAAVPTQADIASFGGTSNPVIQNLLDLNPWGPLPTTNGEVQFTTPFRNRVDSVIGKIDHHIGQDLFTGRYFFGDSDQSFPLALQGGGVAPGYNTVTPTRVNVLSLSYTHVFTPRLLMELRGGYNRFAEDFFPEDSGFDPRTIGLNTLPADANARDFGLPTILIDGIATIGANTSLPRGRVDTNTQAFASASYNTGTHNWKGGVEFRRTFVNGFFDAGYRGRLEFNDLDPESAIGHGTGLDEFLSGVPTGGRSARGASERGTFQNSLGAYLQDSFRLSPRLTVNYGIRWDYYGVMAEERDRFSILDTNTGNLLFVGTNGLERLYPRDFNNFSPRISFAYDLTGSGKTVVRAGWGLYYDAFSQDFFVGQLPWNTFNPGPAYNDIEFVFGTRLLDPNDPDSDPAPIDPNQPVFTDYAATDVFTVDQNLRTPYIQNYNVNIEQELWKGFAARVAYVGSAGRKLFRYRDINQPAVLGDQDTRPFAPRFFYVNQFESTANSRYDSLQVSLRMRDWYGLTTTVNYTWGHSIDNASDGQDYVPNATQPDDSFNPAAERANSNFDTRHRFQWFWTYNIPDLDPESWLWSGWGIDGVVTFSTGMPFNVNYLFEDDFNGSGEFFGRPDLVGDPFAGTSTPDRFLNLSAFRVPCNYNPAEGSCDLADPQFHFGNLRRNAFNGPDYGNVDFSLVKRNKLTERLNMQIRVDVFNLLNHPNFANPMLPNFAVDFLQNGILATGTGDGFLAIGHTPDVATGNPFLGGGGARNVQLGVKFTF
jgi:hypothetical protein